MLLDKPNSSSTEDPMLALAGQVYPNQVHLLHEAAEHAVDAGHLEILVSMAGSALQQQTGLAGLASSSSAAGVSRKLTPMQRHFAVSAFSKAAGMLRCWRRGQALVDVGVLPKKELKPGVLKLGDPMLSQLSGAPGSKQDTQNKLRDMRAALDALAGGWGNWEFAERCMQRFFVCKTHHGSCHGYPARLSALLLNLHKPSHHRVGPLEVVCHTHDSCRTSYDD
jgi:hypothetical protein